MMAVDPGIRYCGVSIWNDGILKMAALVKSPEKVLRGPKAWLEMARAVKALYPLGLDTLVVELQQQDTREFHADDMFQVCGVTGALIGAYDESCRHVVGFYPGWSKVPKTIRHSRLYKPGILSAEEWTKVEKCVKYLEHNRDDGICLGLYYLRQIGARYATKR